MTPHRRIDFWYSPCIPTQNKLATGTGKDRTKCLMDDYTEPDECEKYWLKGVDKNKFAKKKLEECLKSKEEAF